MNVLEPAHRVARLLLIALYPLRVLEHVTRDRKQR